VSSQLKSEGQLCVLGPDLKLVTPSRKFAVECLKDIQKRYPRDRFVVAVITYEEE
jgi:hypothetical protein